MSAADQPRSAISQHCTLSGERAGHKKDNHNCHTDEHINETIMVSIINRRSRII